MSFFALYIFSTKIITSAICTFFSILSYRRKTAPKEVWAMFAGGFGIWFGQTIYNTYVLHYHIIQPIYLRLINDGLFSFIKLVLFVGAVVTMYFNYVNREQV